VGADLGVEVGDVALDGPEVERQLIGGSLVAPACSDKVQDLGLSP
jgi:hypothetical protein